MIIMLTTENGRRLIKTKTDIMLPVIINTVDLFLEEFFDRLF